MARAGVDGTARGEKTIPADGSRAPLELRVLGSEVRRAGVSVTRQVMRRARPCWSTSPWRARGPTTGRPWRGCCGRDAPRRARRNLARPCSACAPPWASGRPRGGLCWPARPCSGTPPGQTDVGTLLAHRRRWKPTGTPPRRGGWPARLPGPACGGGGLPGAVPGGVRRAPQRAVRGVGGAQAGVAPAPGGRGPWRRWPRPDLARGDRGGGRVRPAGAGAGAPGGGGPPAPDAGPGRRGRPGRRPGPVRGLPAPPGGRAGGGARPGDGGPGRAPARRRARSPGPRSSRPRPPGPRAAPRAPGASGGGPAGRSGRRVDGAPGRRSAGPPAGPPARLVLVPRAPAPPAPGHNLPAPLTGFVGRERELAAVRRRAGGGRAW